MISRISSNYFSHSQDVSLNTGRYLGDTCFQYERKTFEAIVSSAVIQYYASHGENVSLLDLTSSI